MFAEALALQPQRGSILMDWADCLLELGAFQAAAEKYEQVLEHHPTDAWALPSALGAAALAGDAEATRRFKSWAAEHPDHPRAVLIDKLAL